MTYRRIAPIAASALVFLAGCGSHQRPAADRTCDGKIGTKQYIVAWFEVGSIAAEGSMLRRQVAAFNRSQNDVNVRVVFVPGDQYTRTVESAAAAGRLPEVLDFDGPNLYSYAWSGKLKPLDSCVSTTQRGDLLPSIRKQGSYAGQTWGVGTFDSGLGLYVRPSILRRIGARIPSGAADGWSAAEFTAILRRLRAAGYRRPLDMKVNYALPGNATPPEWFTYGFSPIVWSAGGDLIDRATYRSAAGTLNGPASVRALTAMQRWFRAGLVNPDTDDHAFIRGRAPISWVGHWMYADYHKAFPRDLKIVPLPRFGPRTSSGMGSWQWGITTNAADGDAAWRFIAFLLRPEQVSAMTRVNGAVPATFSAIRRSPNFASGGPEHVYVDQLAGGAAKPRPLTPAYPAITAAFAGAIRKIIHGQDVQRALDVAVRQIDGDLAKNSYYKPPGS
jgi:multiple sugar transport system substrate-binding protein